MKKCNAALILFMCLMLILASCGGEDKIETTTFTYEQLAQYSIVRGDNAGAATIQAAMDLRDAIHDKTDLELPLTTDWVKRGEEVPAAASEILVGLTNRSESEIADDMRYLDFVIKLEGERIVINGRSEAAVVDGVNYFVENFIGENTVNIPVNGGYVSRYEYPIDALAINAVSISEYTLEFPDGNKDAEEVTGNLFDAIRNLTGYELAFNSGGTENTHKIIVGESKMAPAEASGLYEYADGNVYINGCDKSMLSGAAKYFFQTVTGYDGMNIDSLSRKIDVTLDSKETLYNADVIKQMKPVELYVSHNGSDSNTGGRETPFATLNAAKEKATELTTAVSAPIIVNIEAGDYYISESFTLGEEASGASGSSVTYQAAEGVAVNFIGGVKIDSSRISKVTDNEILSRIIDTEARQNLMQIDLSGIEIEVLQEGNGGTTGFIQNEIYYNDTAMQMARWPNSNRKDNGEDGDYTYTSKLVSTDETNYAEAPFTVYYSDEAEARISEYWGKNPLKDVYIFNYFAQEWFQTLNRVASIDTESKSFTTAGGLVYKPSVDDGKQKRYYFFNVLEEIDVPGEMYIDRDKKIAYFYPDGDPYKADIYVSTMTEPIIKADGASNVTIKNINFLYTRGKALDISNASCFTVDNCVIAHLSSNAITLAMSTDSIIKNCNVYDTGRGGIFVVNSGDRTNLIPSNNIIENNVVHDVTRIATTYISAVGVNGCCGVTVRGNTMYNSPHLLMGIGANNDLVIEYNEFYNAITDCDDAGAIYWGRDSSTLGYVIRNNYFHHMSNDRITWGTNVIYCDDIGTHAEIYNNIFYKCSSEGTIETAVPIGGSGQYANIYNNIFVDNYYSANIGSGETPTFYMKTNMGVAADGSTESKGGRYSALKDIGFFDETWIMHYKGTNWERVWELYTDENFAYVDEWIEKYNGDYQKLTEDGTLHGWFRKTATVNNLFTGNISVTESPSRATPGTTYMGGGGVKFVDDAPVKMEIYCEGNYTSDTDKTDSGKSMFVKYGEDFTLTEEGLDLIRKTIPDFQNILMSEIGANFSGS